MKTFKAYYTFAKFFFDRHNITDKPLRRRIFKQIRKDTRLTIMAGIAAQHIIKVL